MTLQNVKYTPMKLIMTILFSLILIQISSAQAVVCSAAEFSKNSSIQLQWSVGESVVHDFNGVNNDVLSGFQNLHHAAISTAVHEVFERQHQGVSFDVFPNPASDYFQIQSDYSEPMIIEVYDMNGRKLQEIRTYQVGDRISMEGKPVGQYLIHLRNEEMKIATILWQKITL